uniref:Uncharacterized protein n=1 Tax=Rhizophora mucronata TaxID=61149 RepID=A0A2P2JBL2_RHIMU
MFVNHGFQLQGIDLVCIKVFLKCALYSNRLVLQAFKFDNEWLGPGGIGGGKNCSYCESCKP